MAACRNCGGRLAKGEQKCFVCDTPAEEKRSARDANLDRFRTAVTIAFFLCFGLTIASIFMDVGPSFGKCAAATVILHFVKSSAVQMAESKSS